MKIGNYTYSSDTGRRLLDSEFRGRESMISERVNIKYERILICGDNDGYKIIIGIWSKRYKIEDFNRGREEFVEQVILDYTFGVID